MSLPDNYQWFLRLCVLYIVYISIYFIIETIKGPTAIGYYENYLSPTYLTIPFLVYATLATLLNHRKLIFPLIFAALFLYLGWLVYYLLTEYLITGSFKTITLCTFGAPPRDLTWSEKIARIISNQTLHAILLMIPHAIFAGIFTQSVIHGLKRKKAGKWQIALVYMLGALYLPALIGVIYGAFEMINLFYKLYFLPKYQPNYFMQAMHFAPLVYFIPFMVFYLKRHKAKV